MRIAIAIAAAASLIAIQGCSSDMGGKTASASAKAPGANTTLMDAAGAIKGTATLTQASGGLDLAASVTGMAPGAYGIHVHMVGKCEAPAFTSAGAHWNPMQKMHGMENPQGHHMGDLPNIVVGPDGTGTLTATIPDAMLTGGTMPLLDADGAALVVHAAADDYKSDPSGNSGARIACGVLAVG